MKICHDSSHRGCCCSNAKSYPSDRVGDNEYDASCEKHNVENYGDRILENVGYFVASNDEKKTPKYHPTSLQDIDPNELA